MRDTSRLGSECCAAHHGAVPVFQRAPTQRNTLVFRDGQKNAGVDRPELLAQSEHRQPIRVHDLRGTFLTLALANGKSETYRRAPRTAAEVQLGELAPMYLATPNSALSSKPKAKTSHRFPATPKSKAQMPTKRHRKLRKTSKGLRPFEPKQPTSETGEGGSRWGSRLRQYLLRK